MKNNELVDRYIYAVTMRLPNKTSGDVAKELRSIISDMLDERCGEAAPTEQDIKAVLTELGTPSELADKYDADCKKSLIGGIYFTQYKLVIKIVLISVAFGMTIAGTVASIMAQETWYVAFAEWLGVIINSLAGAFTFVTLLFAFFYHKGVKISVQADSLDDLPPVPKHNATIPRHDPIVSIVFSVIFAVIFLAAPQIFCVVVADNGTFIPILNADVMRGVWYLIICLTALSIIKDSVKLIDRSYTRRLMVVTVVADLMSVGLSFWWLMNDKLLNPKLIESLSKIFTDESAVLVRIVSNLQYILLGIIVFSLLVDIVSTVVKTLKYKEN